MKEVRFLRPGGDFEYKDVGWCLDNGMVDCGGYWAASRDAEPRDDDYFEDRWCNDGEPDWIDEHNESVAEAEVKAQLDECMEQMRTERALRDARHRDFAAEEQTFAKEERELYERMVRADKAARQGRFNNKNMGRASGL